jgi:SAM-dependent methyltransferase
VNRSLLVDFVQRYPFQPATAWWRAVEIGHLLRLSLPGGRGIDIGCGDGLLTALVASRLAAAARTWVGIDPDPAEIALAEKTGFYSDLLTGSADRIERPSATFDFAFSNSVLEHIEAVDPVLAEVARVLKPGAPFVFTVPSADFRACLSGPSRLRRLLLRQTRADYLEQIDRRVAHRTYRTRDHWGRSLLAAGFASAQFSHYFTCAEVQRWETISNLTAGVLYEILGRRPPIEIQRQLGLRRSATMPRWCAASLAFLLALGVRTKFDTLSGGLMVVAVRAPGAACASSR